MCCYVSMHTVAGGLAWDAFSRKGDCSGAAFKSSGGHIYAKTPLVHGFMVAGTNDAGNLPNLPNLHVDGAGKVTVELHSTLASLKGAGGRPALLNTEGAALVLHANPDDYTAQPIGNAGDRIACAVIR